MDYLKLYFIFLFMQGFPARELLKEHVKSAAWQMYVLGMFIP